MPPCSQCGKPSVAEVGAVGLCVDCFSKYQAAVSQQQMINLRQAAMLMPLINYASDQIWGTIGLRAPHRLELTPELARMLATESHMETVFNIDRSVIGNLNAGQQQSLGSIAISTGALSQSGHPDIADALKRLAEAVASSPSVTQEIRSQVLEGLDELGSQASRPVEQRSKPFALRAVFSQIGEALQAAGGLAEIWSTWGPVIKGFFGF